MYDMSDEFYSDNPHQNLQLIEYGRTHSASAESVITTADTGSTIFDSENNEVLKILGKNSKGQTIVKRYQLVDPSKVQLPKLGDLTNLDGTTIHLIKWAEKFQGRAMFNDTNINWETIESQLNSLLKNQLTIGEFLAKLTDYLNVFNTDIQSIISSAVGEYLENTLTSGYVSKKQYNNDISDLNTKISNLQKLIKESPAIAPYANPSRTDYYPNNIDVNDQITDENVAIGIKKMEE